MCLYPKCSNLMGELESFFSPTTLALGYVATLISPHYGDPEKAYAFIYVYIHTYMACRG